ITTDLIRCAAAAISVTAVITAGAGIHGCHQLKGCRKGDLSFGSGDSYFATLQRFTQYFQHLTLTLRQLIQKKHAAMRQRNFSRAGIGAAAQERKCTQGVAAWSYRAAAVWVWPWTRCHGVVGVNDEHPRLVASV